MKGLTFNTETGTMEDELGLNPLIQTVPEGVFEAMEFTPENKQWILQSLYFKPIEKGRWEHPVLGDGNYIDFDIYTDDPISLVFKIYKKGFHDYKNHVGKVVNMFPDSPNRA